MKATVNLKISILTAGLGLLTLWARGQQIPYVVMAGGNTVEVERILAKPNGDLTVFRNGQPIELVKDQYARAVGERPQELDRANELRAQGETEQAKELYAGVVRGSAYQSWDVVAGVALANILLEQEKAEDAKRTLSGLESRYGDKVKEFFPEVEAVQWRTRLATGQLSGLEQELTEVILEGQNRRRQAMAQLVRGDLKRKQTDNKAAVLDYLRTVYFFGSDDEVHAEALYKAADTFAEIGDSARAKKFRTRLMETYPNSEFAAKAGQ